MKKKRKQITIQGIPFDGKYQICYIENVLPYVWPILTDTRLVSLGPFLMDLATGKIVPFIGRDFECAEFIQGRRKGGPYPTDDSIESLLRDEDKDNSVVISSGQIGVEKEFVHNCAYGVLTPSFGTYCQAQVGTDQWSQMMPPPGYIATRNYDRSRLLSLDSDGNQLSYLKVYARNSLVPQTRTVPMYVGAFSSYQYGGNAGSVPRTFRIVIDDSRYRTWAQDGTWYDWRWSLPKVFNASGSTVAITLKRRYYNPLTGLVTNLTDLTVNGTIVFTSPVLELPSSSAPSLRSQGLSLVSQIKSEMMQLSNFIPADGEFNSCQKAIDGFRLTGINGIAVVKETAALREFLVPVLKLIRHPLSIKGWAQLLLWYKYGVKLSWKDWTLLCKTFTSIRKARRTMKAYAKYRNSLHSVYGTYYERIEDSTHLWYGLSRVNSRVTARWEIPTALTQWGGFWAMIEDLGLRISAVNAWDLMSFSFVIDWFVGVEKLCADWDYTLECDRLQLREWVYSTRNLVTTDPRKYYDTTGLMGSLVIDTYTRKINDREDGLPKPPWKLGKPAWTSHWWELTLITLSKTTK